MARFYLHNCVTQQARANCPKMSRFQIHMFFSLFLSSKVGLGTKHLSHRIFLDCGISYQGQRRIDLELLVSWKEIGSACDALRVVLFGFFKWSVRNWTDTIVRIQHFFCHETPEFTHSPVSLSPTLNIIDSNTDATWSSSCLPQGTLDFKLF